MSADLDEYQAYTALEPAARMTARLQGLSEVLNASGLQVLSEETVGEPATNRPHGMATGQQAFNEAAAFFGRPVARGEDGAVQMHNSQHYVLSVQDVDGVAKKLGVPRDNLHAALKDLALRK